MMTLRSSVSIPLPVMVIFWLGSSSTGIVGVVNAFSPVQPTTIRPNIEQRLHGYENGNDGVQKPFQSRPTNMMKEFRKTPLSSHPEKGESTEHNSPTSRRQALFVVLTVAATTATAGLVGNPSPSAATYSAYTRREQDWSSRQEKGEIQYSSARELRQQLRDMVPQNSERSRIFCPNGPSAAVSPLMENKCGDRMATPSVYGRSDDRLGNSIPGFSSEWKSSNTNMIMAEDRAIGGFPTYQDTKNAGIRMKQK